MAVDLEQLVVQLSADIKGYEREMRKAAGIADRQARAIENRFRKMNKTLDGVFSRSLRGLAAPVAGIGAALGTAEIVRITSVWTDLSSRVNLAAGSMEKGSEVMGRLGEMARRTYSSFEQTAESYLANATALRELGYSTDDALNYTEALNNALVVSGTKGERAARVIDALSKAMALGKLSGDNLNTVIAQGGRVAEALAAGLNTTVGGLRKLGAEGKISGRDVVKALSSQMQALRKEAEAMPATIADGITLLNNALLQYVGNADHATGISARISEALVMMADNFDKTADVALQLAGVVAGALVGRSLVKMIATLGLGSAALVNFTRALMAARTMGSLTAAFGGLAAAAGPVGMVVGGAVVASLAAFSSTSSEASAAARIYADALAEVERKAKDSAEAITGTTAAIDEKKTNQLAAGIEVAKRGIEEARKAVIDLFTQIIDNAPRRIISEEQLGSLKDLRDGLASNTKSATSVERALYGLANSNPKFQKLADQLSPLLTALSSAVAALDLLEGKMASLGAGPSFRASENASMDAYGAMKAEQDAYITEAERRARLGKEQLALENEIARVKKQSLDDGVALTDGQIKRIAEANIAGNDARSSEGKKAPRERADEYQRLAERISETTATMLAETAVQRQLNPLINDYGYAVERARAEQDLLNAAKKAGKEITPQLRTEIAALAGQYAAASAEAAKLGETQDEIRRRAQEMADFQKDLTRGIVDGFIQGKKAADIFADALTKIGNKLLDMAFNSLFDVQGSGSPFGIIGKLLGFDAGGFTGPGGKNQPAGIVHKGEYVFSKAAVDRIGVGNLEAMHRATKGYAEGGLVGAAPRLPRLSGMNSGVSISMPITLDARGADPAAIGRLEAMVEGMKRSMPGIAIKAVAEARSRGSRALG